MAGGRINSGAQAIDEVGVGGIRVGGREGGLSNMYKVGEVRRSLGGSAVAALKSTGWSIWGGYVSLPHRCRG